MRALTLSLGLGWLACSEQIELFPDKAYTDAGMPDLERCAGQINAAGVLQPCSCLAICASDSDCPQGYCDAVVALCTHASGSCSTTADCSLPNSPPRGWVCKATQSR